MADGDESLIGVAQEVVAVVEIALGFVDAGMRQASRRTKHVTIVGTIGTNGTTVDTDVSTTCGIRAVNTAVFTVNNVVCLTHRSHVTAAVHIVQNLAVVDGNARVAKHLTSNNVTNHGGIGLIRNGIQKYILVFGRTITSTEHRTYDKAT